MREFEGKVAVITGAASGIGWGIAERLAAEGMKVVLSDIDQQGLDVAVQKLRQQERDVIGVLTNVADAASVDQLAAQALSAYGKVHLVCNNAGVLNSAGAIWEASLKDWQWMFGVNIWGVINGVRTFTPILIDQGEESHIVNTASIAGLGLGNSIYSITKHTVVTLTEALYVGLKQRGVEYVGVSVLCPTFVNTNLKDAEQHRPDDLRNPGQSGNATGWDFLWQRLSQGISPEAMSEIVVDGVREGRFYIIPPDYQEEGFKIWADNLINRRNPVLRQFQGGSIPATRPPQDRG
ncbi:MAG TPA: SDR family NAD(P)-dependent oxidoreductase [Dehalococcoidia bacterium]|nr:SDR family NAD(P)-dependent oxidoreductase [Dehalococcoidia bacterium]